MYINALTFLTVLRKDKLQLLILKFNYSSFVMDSTSAWRTQFFINYRLFSPAIKV